MTRIVLSGAESESDFDVLMDVKCTNVLFTYMHLRKQKNAPLTKRRKDNPGMFVFLDSGGYTLRTQPDYLAKHGQTTRKYAEQYIEWLYENYKSLNCAANIDLLDSDPKVTEWCDEELKKFEQETNVPIVYVWHAKYGVQEWERMCERHRYVGFSSTDCADAGGNRSAMLSCARKRGTWVHGFGITDTESLGRDLFYSCDSTTWIMGAKYGRTMAWTGTEFRQFDGDNKQRRQQFRQHFISKGVNWDLIEQDGKGVRSSEIRAETLKMNAIAWMDYQEYLTKRMAPRAYWNIIDEVERRIPDVDQATSAELKHALTEVKYPLDESVNEPEALRNMWSDLFIYARRDEKALKDVDDQVLRDAAAEIDPDFKETDRTRVIDFLRQDALNILVPGTQDKPKSRDTAADLIPTKNQPKQRDNDEELTAYEDGPDLALPEPVFGVNPVPTESPVIANIVQANDPVNATEQAPIDAAVLPAYPDFIQGLADETLRLRARLLVDATRRYSTARTELNVLRLKRASDKEIKRVKKLALAASQEVKFVEKQIPAETRKQLTDWLASNAPQPVTSDEPKRTYAITTANASQVGKLGGAPKGNINAMRHGIYSKKLPALACDTCPIAGQCYMHRPGNVCAFDKEFKKLQVTDVESAIDIMRDMVNTDLERVQRQLLFETAQGGVANTDTTGLLNATFQKVDKVRELMKVRELQGSPTPTIGANGMTVTETQTRVISGPAQALGNLFSAMLANKPQIAPSKGTEEERKEVQAEVASE